MRLSVELVEKPHHTNIKKQKDIKLERKLNLNIEIIRFIAIILVISEHVLSELAMNYDGTIKWLPGVLIWSFIKINVPLFLIISASLSFKDGLTAKEVFIKKTKRVAVPIIFWSIFYTLFYSENRTLGAIIINIINGSAMYHLYFMYMFIGFFFFFPLINNLYFRSKNSFFFYFFTLVASCSLIPTINKVFSLNLSLFNITGLSSFGLLVFYAFVPKISECVKNKLAKHISNKSIFVYSLSLYFISCVITFLFAVYVKKTNGDIYSVINGGSFFVFLSSILFYQAIMCVDASKINDKLIAAIVFTGRHAFGIYLIHPAILYFILKYVYYPKLSATSHDSSVVSVTYFLLSLSTVFLSSLLASFLIEKIKYLKKTI